MTCQLCSVFLIKEAIARRPCESTPRIEDSDCCTTLGWPGRCNASIPTDSLSLPVLTHSATKRPLASSAAATRPILLFSAMLPNRGPRFSFSKQTCRNRPWRPRRHQVMGASGSKPEEACLEESSFCCEVLNALI